MKIPALRSLSEARRRKRRGPIAVAQSVRDAPQVKHEGRLTLDIAVL
jgi:hypothetical protein